MTELIFKIVPAAEWQGGDYHGSAHDQTDGFLHFSTAAQLPDTLRLYYSGQTDLLLVAADAAALGDALKWEQAPSRGQDFPHLYGPLPQRAVTWVRPITHDVRGFVLPPL